MRHRLPRNLWPLGASFAEPRRRVLTGALVSLALLLPAWWVAGEWHHERLLTDRRGLILAELTPRGTALVAALNRRLALLEGLRAFVQAELASTGSIHRNEFNTFAAALYAGGKGIRSFEVAPGGVTRYVYPLGGSELTVGHDLFRDERPNVRADVARAIRLRQVILSGPYELDQAGLGLVARLAVHRGGSFWGIASVALEIPPLLAEAGISPNPGFLTLAIRDAAGKVFHGQEAVLQANPVLYEVGLPEGTWTLAAIPAAGWDAAIWPMLLLFRGTGLVVLGLLVGLVYQVISRQACLAQAVRQRTGELQRDLAERRQMEEALRLSRAYFSNIVDLSEDAIISTNRAQRINLFNQGAEKIFGYRAAEVLGKPLDILLPQRYVASHAKHVEDFTSSPDVLRPMNERGTVFGQRKDGGEFPAEASIAKFEVRGEQVLTVRLRDITERRRAEDKLLQLAAIIESSGDAIIGKTLDGTILTWNPGAERLFGYSAEEIRGRSVSLLTSADRRAESSQIYERIRQGDSVAHHETVRLRKDGTRVNVSISFSPIRDVSARIVGMSAIARDITERKHLEAQIRQAQKMEAIGTLAGGIAHDFNNILSALIGYTEMALDDMPKGSRAWQNLQEVFIAGRRAKDLVQQILTFSRQREQERTLVSLNQIIKEALKLLRASLPATIEIRQQIDEESGVVLADATQIHQVLMNLCTNAEQAMRERGGVLDVRLKAVEVDAESAAIHPGLMAGPYARLTVRDSGHGMEPSVRERIFDPFFTTKAQGEGTGMGLAVVHGIVTGHGGAILIETVPGRGTTFEIYLPRHDNPLAKEAPAEETIRGGKERILLVEDETHLSYLWEIMLQRLGYVVTSHTNGHEALDAFRAAPQSFDLVITDQTMPHLTGETVAKELLRIRPDIPVILCTGFSHTMTAERARAIGIHTFLMKPLGRRDLALAVRRALDRSAS